MDRKAIEVLANEFGDMFAKSTEIREELQSNIDAKVHVGRGPLFLMLAIEKAIGPENMERLPVPGSTDKETNNPDIFHWHEMNARGKRMERSGSFYKEMYKSHIGAQDEADLEHVKNALANKPEGVPKHIANMGRPELVAEEKRLKANRNNGLNALITAISLHFQLKEIKEHFGDKLEVVIQRDKDGNVEKTATPILIFNRTNPLEANAFSPADIRRMNIPQAVEGHGEHEAGSFNALRYSKKETAARTPQSNGGKEAEDKLTIVKMDDFENTLSKLGNFLKGDNAYDRVLAWINTTVESDHKDRVLLFGNLCLNADGIWEAIKQEYRVLSAAENRANTPAGAKHAA